MKQTLLLAVKPLAAAASSIQDLSSSSPINSCLTCLALAVDCVAIQGSQGFLDGCPNNDSMHSFIYATLLINYSNDCLFLLFCKLKFSYILLLLACSQPLAAIAQLISYAFLGLHITGVSLFRKAAQ